MSKLHTSLFVDLGIGHLDLIFAAFTVFLHPGTLSSMAYVMTVYSSDIHTEALRGQVYDRISMDDAGTILSHTIEHHWLIPCTLLLMNFQNKYLVLTRQNICFFSLLSESYLC